MAFRWQVVGNTGYDVEEVDHPRTVELDCPSCDHHVRFVEKELVKNLRLFSVPLIGIEKGRRVFECPRCRVCIEAPEETAARETEDPKRAALRKQLAGLEDERWLWTNRGDLASRRGDPELAQEAREYATRIVAEMERVRMLLERLAAPEGPTPAIVARAGGAIVDRAPEDEFVALKRRLATRRSDEPSEDATSPKPDSATQPSTGTAPAPDATPSPAATPEPTVTPTEPAPTPPSAASPKPAPAAPEPDVSSAFAALKARITQRASGEEGASDRDDDAPPVHADVAPARPGEVAPDPPPSVPGEDDSDPMLALKRKLRPKST